SGGGAAPAAAPPASPTRPSSDLATGDDRYATRVARHLRSWWAANPPLRGVHWVSGIELGIRLLSWVWTRRLLDGWPAVSRLFEEDRKSTRLNSSHVKISYAVFGL